MSILIYSIIIWYFLNIICSVKLMYDDIYKKGLDYTILDIIVVFIVFIIPLGLIVFLINFMLDYKDFVVIKGKKN